jgi:uroporphyrinogen-III synthase
VLLTSANAVRALLKHPQHQELAGLRVYAVGRHTADAAQAAGFADIASADGRLPDLVRLVTTAESGKLLDPLLYLAGAERSGDLVGELAAAGIVVEMRVVYRAVAETDLSAEVIEALAGGGIDGVLHFSRRSTQAFVTAVESAGLRDVLRMRQFCLSSQVAAPLAAAGAGDLRIAHEPAEEALIRLVESG